ncbi:hypothetical protein CesoFtcFv8_002365 [Champsocephalus esox]|uniref:Uncharacterized protein n=1 Tax=Champsocephalus esox TaxID=159716 RepID=A0AAN8HDW0_9TELE|nr:hypothetical protein CesoFtcFv8_002365 [Champsocephalus esox]
MLGKWSLLFSHMCSSSSSLLLLWTLVGLDVVEVSGSQPGIPLSVVKLWASAFGGEIKSISAKYSGSQLLQKDLWAITAPRPGTNSSSEPGSPVKGRINPKNAACLAAWEESGGIRGSPRKHGESFQTAYRKRLLGPNLGPPCTEKYKEPEKSVRVEEIDGVKLVKNLALKLEEVFWKKAEATRRLVEAAEEAHHQHEYNPDLQVRFVPDKEK